MSGIRAAVVTVSDGVTQGTRADGSGDAAEALLREAGFDVAARATVPDERPAIETVLHAMDERGTTIAELWCLEENHRARRLYEYLGWRPTDEVREAPWPPYPLQMVYTRLIVQSER